MTDRELLELAAKAAGYDVAWNELWGCFQHRHLIPDRFGSVRFPWVPLEDDGDALRLAVELRLTISCDRYDDDDYMVATPPPHTHQGFDCLVDQDPHAATRRAIVRAAAKIGEDMT